jgi:hypothetical protein
LTQSVLLAREGWEVVPRGRGAADRHQHRTAA